MPPQRSTVDSDRDFSLLRITTAYSLPTSQNRGSKGPCRLRVSRTASCSVAPLQMSPLLHNNLKTARTRSGYVPLALPLPAPPHAVDSRGNALGVRKGPSTPYSMCTARTFLSYSIRISWQNSCFIAATSDLYFSFSDSTDMSCLFNVYTDHSDREGFTRICWDSVSDREIGVTCSLSSVG